MTVKELVQAKEGSSIICVLTTGKFIEGQCYEIEDTPVGKLIRYENGVGKFVVDMLDNFEVKR